MCTRGARVCSRTLGKGRPELSRVRSFARSFARSFLRSLVRTLMAGSFVRVSETPAWCGDEALGAARPLGQRLCGRVESRRRRRVARHLEEPSGSSRSARKSLLLQATKDLGGAPRKTGAPASLPRARTGISNGLSTDSQRNLNGLSKVVLGEVRRGARSRTGARDSRRGPPRSAAGRARARRPLPRAKDLSAPRLRSAVGVIIIIRVSLSAPASGGGHTTTTTTTTPALCTNRKRQRACAREESLGDPGHARALSRRRTRRAAAGLRVLAREKLKLRGPKLSRRRLVLRADACRDPSFANAVSSRQDRFRFGPSMVVVWNATRIIRVV